MTTTIKSFRHRRALQYAGDQDAVMNENGNNHNIMDHADNTSSYQHLNDLQDRPTNRLDGLSNLTDDNIMSWYDNNTDNFLFGSNSNSTNVTSSPFMPGGLDSIANGGTGSDDAVVFDPKVFWFVNAFILVLLASTIAFCCFGKKEWLFPGTAERRQASDEAYRQTVLQRRRRRQEAKVDSPEQRTKKLLKSFALNKVSMVRKDKRRESGYSGFREDDYAHI
jgi:hypothetical protein